MLVKSLFNGALAFLPGAGYSSNSVFICVDSNTVLIVDVGTPENIERVNTVLLKYFSATKKVILVASHEHYDHVGGFAEFCKKRFCVVNASEKTATVLTKGDPIYSVADLFGTSLDSVSVNKILKDGEVISTILGPFVVIETPGHSQGSICLYNEKHGILIAGDTIFPNGGFGRTDLPGGNLNLLKKSIAKLATLRVNVLISGHGEIVLSDGNKHVQMAFDIIHSL